MAVHPRDLVEGHGEDLWPRPGRIFAAARSPTFHQLAAAIDDAFARWDRAHLHQFWIADQRITTPDPEFDGPDEEVLNEHRVTLARLQPGERFVYEFDFGDCWTHLCTVGDHRIDSLETGRDPSPSPAALLGVGVTSPTSTAAAGTATTARTRRHQTREGPTSPTSDRGGDGNLTPATRADRGTVDGRSSPAAAPTGTVTDRHRHHQASQNFR